MTLTVLKVPSWSLRRKGVSWQILIWCHMTCFNPLKFLWKISYNFNIRNPIKTLPVLQVSPWSLGACEIPDEPGDGVIWHVSILRSYCENFINIQHQEPCQDSTCPPSPFLESWRTWRFVTNLEMVSDEWEHPFNLLWGFHQEPTSSQHIQN